ncbi:hypothetical protein [Nonomuraea sp. NPDC052265]|uniref:hypothetical protein n=1 Tax=Nonomuraea sp. NPDC052265 TaxID=3364374 RepID=UPI0037C7D83F
MVQRVGAAGPFDAFDERPQGARIGALTEVLIAAEDPVQVAAPVDAGEEVPSVRVRPVEVARAIQVETDPNLGGRVVVEDELVEKVVAFAHRRQVLIGRKAFQQLTQQGRLDGDRLIHRCATGQDGGGGGPVDGRQSFKGRVR